jgi:hypothetical protein
VGRALGSPEEKADIIGTHKRPGFVGEGKEALAYGRVTAAFPPEATQGHALHAASCRLERARLSESKCDGARLLVPLWRSRTLAPIYTSLFDDADGGFSRPVPQTSSERRKPAAMPLRYRAGQ